MDNSHIDSAYIVQSQIISLSDRPFPSPKGIRSVWHPLFNSKNCFTDLGNLIYDPGIRYDQLPPKPFIRNIGSIWFNTRSARLECPFERYELGSYLLTGNKKEWEDFLDYSKTIFGFDFQFEDQRMNYLSFEVCKPLLLKAKTDDETQAEGKVFIHIYPSGYLVLHLAIALNWHDGRSLKDLQQIILQTRPWREDNRWIWSSRIGSGKLSEIIKLINDNLQKSFYVNSSTPLRHGSWKSSLKLISAADSKQIASELLLPEGKYEILDMQNRKTYMRYLLSSRQGLICIFKPESNRKSALRFFWKILFLSEFVEYKNQVYEDYAKFLRIEVNKLKDFRLSLIRKATKEDLLRFSVYNHMIPQFLFTLDNHIHSAAPFHRYIYSTISTGTGFDLRRDKVKKLIIEWEKEVEQWEPTLSLLWKKIISPIRSLLASEK